MTSGEGKYKVESYKWEGDNYQYLSVIMMGEKVSSERDYFFAISWLAIISSAFTMPE